MGKGALTDDVSMKVEGLNELYKKLATFEVSVTRRIVTSALREAAKPVVSAAKSNAQKTKHPSSGALAESIGIKAVRFGSGRTYKTLSSLWVGSIRNSRGAIEQYETYWGGTDVSSVALGVRHGHLVELGTKHSAPRPWLMPALKGSEGRVVSVFKQTLSKRIERQVKKMNRGKR